MMYDDKKIFNNAYMMLFIKQKKFRYHDRNYEFKRFKIFNKQYLNALRIDLFHFCDVEFRLIYCII